MIPRGRTDSTMSSDLTFEACNTNTHSFCLFPQAKGICPCSSEHVVKPCMHCFCSHAGTYFSLLKSLLPALALWDVSAVGLLFKQLL